MIDRLALFGATGDLAGRLLFPALAALRAARRLPDDFTVVGAGRHDWDDERFRVHVKDMLEQHAADVPADAREAIVGSLRYHEVDATDSSSVANVIRVGASDSKPIAAYLALPPSVFPDAVTALGVAGLPKGSRIVLEKPFGNDGQGAAALNRILKKAIGNAHDQDAFRVDHVLGMTTVQNLLMMRGTNRVLDAVWNSTHVEQIDVLWEETLALEGRAGYYDSAGALKDVMQNHMMQVFSLLAMEPPASFAEHDLRNRKVEVLRAVRPLHPDDVPFRTRRARYTAGHLVGDEGARDIPSYVDEDGVEPARGTETFAEVVLEIDNRRWAGTRFVLRAGKALRQKQKGVVVRFRPSATTLIPIDGTRAAPNELRVGLDGPLDIVLQLTGGSPQSKLAAVPVALSGEPPAPDLPPYGHVLLDVLSGGCALSVRGDEAEEAWRIVTPVLEAWAAGRVPLEEYAAGSDGPPPLSGRARVTAEMTRAPSDARPCM
jgi:glucose-6-phosphate 1-dehydrogenase